MTDLEGLSALVSSVDGMVALGCVAWAYWADLVRVSGFLTTDSSFVASSALTTFSNLDYSFALSATIACSFFSSHGLTTEIYSEAISVIFSGTDFSADFSTYEATGALTYATLISSPSFGYYSLV